MERPDRDNLDPLELQDYIDYLQSQLKESNSKLLIERRFRAEDATDHQGDQIMYSKAIQELKSQLKEMDDEFKILDSLMSPVKPEERKDFIMRAMMGVTLTTEDYNDLQSQLKDKDSVILGGAQNLYDAAKDILTLQSQLKKRDEIIKSIVLAWDNQDDQRLDQLILKMRNLKN